MTDTQLVGRFVSRSDPRAFQDLVARHGPTVMKVCRYILRDPIEAEDAFQATFLVLVRKAPSIRDPETLGSWLNGVARRVSLRARRKASRRQEHERRRAEMFPAKITQDPSWDGLERVIREELDRLPEAYRSPLELCYLKGLTHEEASVCLGWPLGTVKVRLVRARKVLKERLERRGLAPSLVLLLLMLFLAKDADADVPDELVESTVDAMNLQATGESAVLKARYPEAINLADSLARSTSIVRILLVLTLLIGGSLGAVTTTAFASGLLTVEEPVDLPASLMDVLNIDCR